MPQSPDTNSGSSQGPDANKRRGVISRFSGVVLGMAAYRATNGDPGAPLVAGTAGGYLVHRVLQELNLPRD